MNTTQKQAIAQLPDDAFPMRVIGAWADAPLELIPFGAIIYPNDERLLRRWLLDGGYDVEYTAKTPKGTYAVALIDYKPGGKSLEVFADSPEAAFTAAVAQFASALREGAK